MRWNEQHLWRRSWLLAAHIDELPAKGDFLLWDNAGQPVLLVHGDRDEIVAFYNTCSHRGAPVVTEPRGNRRRFTCPYHGWSYNRDGELMAIRDPEDFHSLDLAQRGLKSIRCERFGNLIFVNFDPEAPALLEWLGPIAAEWEEFQFDNCRLAARHVFDLNCNWKIAMEANTEVYHVRSIHATTVAPVLDDRRNVNTLYPNGHGRMVAPMPAGKQTIEIMPVSPDIAQIDTVGEIGRTCTQSYGVFPNWVVPLSQYVIPPLLFWPNGIDKCRMETWTLAPAWKEGLRPDLWTENNGAELCAVLQGGHAVRRENPVVDAVLRFPGRAAELPGGAHLPLEPGGRPLDRHREHSAGTAGGAGHWRRVDLSQRPAPAFA